MRCLFVKIESVFGKVVDNAFDRHGVEIAQLRNPGDERSVKTGVLQRSERGLCTNQAALGLYGMNMKDFLNELRRYHDITDNVTHFVKGCFLLIRHPIRIDVLLDRLHLKVHVTLGAIVATGLALCRLAFSFSLLFFFGF